MDKTVSTALEFVLDFEAKGTEMYLKLAREAKHPLGKKLFYSLAGEEVVHARKADDIFQEINGKQTASEESGQALPSIENVMKDFFERSVDKDLETEREDLIGYTLAMEMERKGYKAYSDFLNAATDPREKEFFSRMLLEEKEHLDALANVYAYLTNTDDWMQEEESKVWNWMNM